MSYYSRAIHHGEEKENCIKGRIPKPLHSLGTNKELDLNKEANIKAKGKVF